MGRRHRRGSIRASRASEYPAPRASMHALSKLQQATRARKARCRWPMEDIASSRVVIRDWIQRRAPYNEQRSRSLHMAPRRGVDWHDASSSGSRDPELSDFASPTSTDRQNDVPRRRVRDLQCPQSRPPTTLFSTLHV